MIIVTDYKRSLQLTKFGWKHPTCTILHHNVHVWASFGNSIFGQKKAQVKKKQKCMKTQQTYTKYSKISFWKLASSQPLTGVSQWHAKDEHQMPAIDFCHTRAGKNYLTYMESWVHVHVFLAMGKKLNLTSRPYLAVTIIVCAHNTIIINFF